MKNSDFILVKNNRKQTTREWLDERTIPDQRHPEALEAIEEAKSRIRAESQKQTKSKRSRVDNDLSREISRNFREIEKNKKEIARINKSIRKTKRSTSRRRRSNGNPIGSILILLLFGFVATSLINLANDDNNSYDTSTGYELLRS